MIKKCFDLLKKNPVLILFYAVFMLSSFLIMYLVFPNNMNEFMDMNSGTINFAAYINAMTRILVTSLVVYIIGLLFFSGIGNMIREALIRGKTSMAAVFPGIKKYFVRVLLSSLLLMAFAIGFSIIISIITVPLVLMSLENVYLFSIIYPIGTMVLVIAALPFIILWFPAIFIDDARVIQGLVSGAKAGLKNYWRVLLLMIVMYIPATVNMILSYDTITNGEIFHPGMIVTYILSAAISLFVFPYLFVLYYEYSNRSNRISLEETL